MIITFPRVGTLHIAIATLFKTLGIEVLLPPPISKRTVELGVRYSPETVCLPFKIMLGNFIEALLNGADTIVTCGGVGPCRLGYFGAVQEEVLRTCGFQFKMIVVEPNIWSVLRTMSQVAAGRNLIDVYRSFILAFQKITILDNIEEQVIRARCRETVPGAVDQLWEEVQNSVLALDDIAELENCQARFLAKLANLVTEKAAGLKIGLVGEIYVMQEPFANLDLVRRLGRLGAATHKTLQFSDYIKTHLLHNRAARGIYQEIVKSAANYLPYPFGGHGLEGVGQIVSSQKTYDGIIHVYPFTCMPEIVVKNIMPRVSSGTQLPVLSLSFDEQSGEAGLVTRLEAFVDLLNYRNQRL